MVDDGPWSVDGELWHFQEERIVERAQAAPDGSWPTGWPPGEMSQRIVQVKGADGDPRFFYRWSLGNADRGSNWWERSSSPQRWAVYFRTAADSTRRSVEVQSDMSMHALRRKIARELAREQDAQSDRELRLQFHGRNLSDNDIKVMPCHFVFFMRAHQSP